MNSFDGQTLAALLCVTLAVVAIARWTARWWRGHSVGGCGACRTGCGTANKSTPTRLQVTLPIVDAPELEPATESK